MRRDGFARAPRLVRSSRKLMVERASCASDRVSPAGLDEAVEILLDRRICSLIPQPDIVVRLFAVSLRIILYLHLFCLDPAGAHFGWYASQDRGERDAR